MQCISSVLDRRIGVCSSQSNKREETELASSSPEGAERDTDDLHRQQSEKVAENGDSLAPHNSHIKKKLEMADQCSFSLFTFLCQ